LLLFLINQNKTLASSKRKKQTATFARSRSTFALALQRQERQLLPGPNLRPTQKRPMLFCSTFARSRSKARDAQAKGGERQKQPFVIFNPE
jgi:hypothetical protein